MSKANKRERQRQNRELAKIERERLIKRDKRMRTVRGLLFVLVPIVILFVIFSVIRSDDKKSTPKLSAPKMTIDPTKTYTASIETSKGTIDVKLDPKTAPIATNNFVSLARKGKYNGSCIDRAATDFVIQGGRPKCDLTADIGYTVKGEVPKDNYPVGSIAGAKMSSEAPGTMGSDFFIVTGPNGGTLPNDYARFGNVTSGLDVAQAIEKLAPASGDGPPTEKVAIKKVTITES